MKKASIVVSSYYKNNGLFDLENKFLNRDDCLRPFYQLKKYFDERGYELNTDDINRPSESDIVIYNEMPKKLSGIEREKSFLLLFESELVRPDNWNVNHHKLFDKVFTWNDNFVDNKLYFKFKSSTKRIFSNFFLSFMISSIKLNKLVELNLSCSITQQQPWLS